MALRFTQLDGAVIEVPDPALQAFKASFRGALLTADDPAYDETRKVWNAMIDRRPALLARCTGTADVRARRAVRARAPHRSTPCAAAATTSPASRCAKAA